MKIAKTFKIYQNCNNNNKKQIMKYNNNRIYKEQKIITNL